MKPSNDMSLQTWLADREEYARPYSPPTPVATLTPPYTTEGLSLKNAQNQVIAICTTEQIATNLALTLNRTYGKSKSTEV